jgi:O-acetyl-ADP-ribose deacetylase (regulator of RNase III)
MIEWMKGDILAANAEALVNTVNCVGIMGRGIALQFRKAFPDNFKAYRAACERGEVRPGSMFVFETGQLTNPRYIINFPTKRHWKGKSRIEDIEAGLVALADTVAQLGVGSIAVPPLGCGLGGLSWSEVRPRIERALSRFPNLRALVFEPSGTPDPRTMTKTAKVPNMTVGRAALIGLMNRYLAGLMDPFVSLLELHKLMYFMQEAGEPLRLRYTKALYGPYSENLRQVLTTIEGHFISGYADAGDAPDKQIEVVPGAVDEAINFLEKHGATRQRFDRVVDLVEGFGTPFGMELLSTVHWVASQEGASTSEIAIDRTHAWNGRKRMFTSDQIRLAWNVLVNKGWLPQAQDAAGDR